MVWIRRLFTFLSTIMPRVTKCKIAVKQFPKSLIKSTHENQVMFRIPQAYALLRNPCQIYVFPSFESNNTHGDEMIIKQDITVLVISAWELVVWGGYLSSILVLMDRYY